MQVSKLIVIPTYNEKENIEKIISKVFSYKEGYHILIVDDGSPDGTAQIVKDLQAIHTNSLFLLERQGKQGLGTAYIAGFKWGIARNYQYLFEMDADFSHPTDKLNDLFEACNTGGADVCVGSRYIRGGNVKNWPWDRIFISYGASVYTRLITFMPVKDCTAGFVCYKKEVLENISLDTIQFVGYAFQIEMKYRAWKQGYKIVEIPITFIDRVEGISKMTKGIVKEAVLGVWKMKSYKKK